MAYSKISSDVVCAIPHIKLYSYVSINRVISVFYTWLSTHFVDNSLLITCRKRTSLMPELPEVETIRSGLKPILENALIQGIEIRNPKLRWPIPLDLPEKIGQQRILSLARRGKYLLVIFKKGALIIHLGMSGSLKIVRQDQPFARHDHVDFFFNNNLMLRYTDPRRFGAILWSEDNPYNHKLIKSMGVEPLEEAFCTDYLFEKTRNHRTPIKTLLMDAKVVVGIGNIYATESLFLARIHPANPACSLTREQCQLLVKITKQVLQSAIERGGTTLKDFVNSDGRPGYFSQQLVVYGRKGLPCFNCHTTLEFMRINQRTTVFCPNCQTIG